MTPRTLIPLEGRYLGNLQFAVEHGPTGQALVTDGRRGQCGPTDYFAASVASCVCTLIGVVADRRGLDVSSMRFRIDKGMTNEPVRRVGHIPITVYLPAALQEKDRRILENAGRTCPVHRSLHPDIHAPIEYVYE
jgi:uncharacterized OsmC-like protein